MANNPLPASSWGNIPAAKKQPNGRYRAVAWYKTRDGQRIQRARQGTTARKAEYALLAHFQEMREEEKLEMAAEDAKEAARSADARFSNLVEEWIGYIEAGGTKLRVSTAYEYARIARADIVPALGALPLSEIDVKACADFLHGLIDGKRNYAKAEHARVVLSKIMTWCAGRGLVAGNPVKTVAALPAPSKPPVKIIEKEDMATVLKAVRAHCEAKLCERRPGPRPNLDIPDGIELLMGTGMRISEMLGLRWEDVWIDNPDDGYWVQINGKVGWEKEKGMVRHDYGKTGDKITDLRISPQVAAMLRSRRKDQMRSNPNGAIFPERAGKWLHQHNFRRRWRTVRSELNLVYDIPEESGFLKQERRQSAGITTVTPHTFRRSVGTFLGETVSIDVAAQQLGHKRTATTIRSYMRERQEAPDSSSNLAAIMYKG